MSLADISLANHGTHMGLLFILFATSTIIPAPRRFLFCICCLQLCSLLEFSKRWLVSHNHFIIYIQFGKVNKLGLVEQNRVYILNPKWRLPACPVPVPVLRETPLYRSTVPNRRPYLRENIWTTRIWPGIFQSAKMRKSELQRAVHICRSRTLSFSLIFQYLNYSNNFQKLKFRKSNY